MKVAREPRTLRPLILALDQDADALGCVKRELHTRYEADYRLACESSAEDALERLRGLETGDHRSALRCPWRPACPGYSRRATSGTGR